MAPGSDSPKATFEHKSLESADTHATCSRGAVGSREWARCVPGAVFRARVAAVGTRRVRVHTRLFTSARCPSDPAAGLQVMAPARPLPRGVELAGKAVRGDLWRAADRRPSTRRHVAGAGPSVLLRSGGRRPGVCRNPRKRPHLRSPAPRTAVL